MEELKNNIRQPDLTAEIKLTSQKNGVLGILCSVLVRMRT